MDNTTKAYIAERKFAEDFKSNYIASATPAQRNSKHFDCGYDGYYNEPDHLALLATFGFNSVEEFHTAVDATDWKIAYNKFNKLQSKLVYKSDEYNALWMGVKQAGFYDEEDHNLDGLALWNIAKKAAPKYAQEI